LLGCHSDEQTVLCGVPGGDAAARFQRHGAAALDPHLALDDVRGPLQGCGGVAVADDACHQDVAGQLGMLGR
jgi:hypothetical protein